MVKLKDKAKIKDERFKKILSDPRFRTLAKKERKIQLDDRFKAMFTNPEFQVPVPLKVDERGVEVSEVQNPLVHAYDTTGMTCIDEEGNFKWDVPSSSESEEEMAALEPQPMMVEQEKAPLGDASKRIAVMNCDWNIVKAVDLLCVFRSFHPSVEKVSIYPSEFGKQRLAQEAEKGPLVEGNAEDEEIDQEKLREYEIEQLKYYYAVIECPNTEVAQHVYDECDGLELERTSNVLDLRFIPEDVKLPYEPREIATEIPKNYKLLDLYTKALQQSRVTLSWDETPRERTIALRRAFVDEDIDDEEMEKFMAPPSSEEDEEKEPLKDIKDQVLGKSAKISQFNKQQKNDLDLEIKFHSAFDDIGKSIQKGEQNQSVWDKVLEKKSKKKKVAREERKKEIKERKKNKIDKKSLENLKMLVDSKGDVAEFNVDIDDDRFSKLYTDPTYGIDPTSNQFKVDSDGNKLLLNYQIKKRKIN